MDKLEINFPHLDWKQKSYPFTCRRTIRKGGFLIQQQALDQKQVIHSYGHGGAEFSLSFGSAYLTNKMLTMKQSPTSIHEVAVLGAGITGLITALQLLKTGYKVNLYAQNFPKYKQTNHEKRIGSQQGLQFWYPGFYDLQDPVKHEFVSKIAYRFFKECLDQNKYQSLKWVNCFISGPQADNVPEVVTEFITKDIKKVMINFGSTKQEEFLCFKTFLIDTELFIQEILTQLKLRKVTLISKKFQSPADIQSLSQKSVYNCLSQSAEKLFGEENLSSMVGHYVKFSLEKPIEQNFIIWNSMDDQMQDDIVVTVSGKTVQFGSSWRKDSSNLQIQMSRIQKIILNAQKYIEQRSPKKLDL